MASTLPVVSFGYAAVTAAAGGSRVRSNRLFDSFLAAPELPPGIAAKTHRLAASLAAGRGNYSAARRHLRAAARLDPADAETHYLLGQAFEADPFGSDASAARHYRAAAKLTRTNATYRAAFGRAAVRAGLRTGGLKTLARAASLAPRDPAVLSVVVDGLLDAGRVRTARRIVARARFLSGGDARIEALWNRVRFATARADQLRPAPDGILPFVRVISSVPHVGAGRIVRADPPSRPRPHLVRYAGRKQRR
jgi:hypothetical protein